MFAQMFPCLPYLETLAFIAETKVAFRKAKIFPTKFRNIWTLLNHETAKQRDTRTKQRNNTFYNFYIIFSKRNKLHLS